MSSNPKNSKGKRRSLRDSITAPLETLSQSSAVGALALAMTDLASAGTASAIAAIGTTASAGAHASREKQREDLELKYKQEFSAALSDLTHELKKEIGTDIAKILVKIDSARKTDEFNYFIASIGLKTVKSMGGRGWKYTLVPTESGPVSEPVSEPESGLKSRSKKSRRRSKSKDAKGSYKNTMHGFPPQDGGYRRTKKRKHKKTLKRKTKGKKTKRRKNISRTRKI